MQPWFFRDPARFKHERDAIDALRGAAAWLRGAEWRIDSDLCLDVVISAHGHDYDLRVSFPTLFPDAPASVRPLDSTVALSSHQYGGAGGPLCLEWGPDNWHRDVTAAQLLESTYRLLEIENPLGRDRPSIPNVAPSRHSLSVGQAARSEWVRWYASDWLEGFIKSQPLRSFGCLRFSCRQLGENWACLVHEANPIEGEVEEDPQLPTTICRESKTDLNLGVWFKTDLEPESIQSVTTLDELRSLLARYDSSGLLLLDGSTPIEGLGVGLTGVLIGDRDSNNHLFVVTKGGLCIRFAPVRSNRTARVRIVAHPPDLCDKRVGIVGLGSAGSKIALSLGRMGIRKFWLVDHDIFLPENIERHALDWRHVTQHKVDGVESALRLIDPQMSIELSRLHLTGQESNAAVSGVLARLAECDVLIDATANPRVFNLLSAVATAAARPIVWLQIFGGGIGGMVARSRPGLEPGPQDMRLLFLQFCAENPAPASLLPVEDYAFENADGEVLTASDADVGVIASHAARIAIDSLPLEGNSAFPHSMYLIGMRAAWVFQAPFATIPISCENVQPVLQPKAALEKIGLENLNFLAELLANREKK